MPPAAAHVLHLARRLSSLRVLSRLQPLRPVRPVVKALRQFAEDDMATYAAAVTYHMLFSLLPFTLLLLIVLDALGLSGTFDFLREQSTPVFLQQTVPQVNRLLDQLEQHRHGVFSVSMVVGLWAASVGMRAAMRAINKVYGVKDQRAWWRRYLGSVAYALFVGLLLALAAGLVMVDPHAVAQLAQRTAAPDGLALLWHWWLRWPIALALLTVALAFLYSVSPDVEHRFRFVTPGACAAIALWLVVSAGFNFYLQRLSDYGGRYGNLATLVVVMLFFYFSSIILLFGAELNAVIDGHGTARVDPDDVAAGRIATHG